MERCTHTDQIRDVQPSAQGCEECLEIGRSTTLLDFFGH
jgi:hypothetical protein